MLSSQYTRSDSKNNTSELHLVHPRQIEIKFSQAGLYDAGLPTYRTPKTEKIGLVKRNWIRSTIYRLQSREIKPSASPLLAQDNNYK